MDIVNFIMENAIVILGILGLVQYFRISDLEHDVEILEILITNLIDTEVRE